MEKSKSPCDFLVFSFKQNENLIAISSFFLIKKEMLGQDQININFFLIYAPISENGQS